MLRIFSCVIAVAVLASCSSAGAAEKTNDPYKEGVRDYFSSMHRDGLEQVVHHDGQEQ
jgi:hypothetical protein